MYEGSGVYKDGSKSSVPCGCSRLRGGTDTPLQREVGSIASAVLFVEKMLGALLLLQQ